MIEFEHPELTEADKEEAEFLRRVKHDLAIFKEKSDQGEPVKVPQHERAP